MSGNHTNEEGNMSCVPEFNGILVLNKNFKPKVKEKHSEKSGKTVSLSTGEYVFLPICI